MAETVETVDQSDVSTFGPRPIEPSAPLGARVIQVIEVAYSLGNGVTTPYRGARRYYTLEGTFLAEADDLNRGLL